MLQLSEFIWALRSSVWIVFNNFLLIDATDRSKISSDQKRLFFAVSLYPLSFFANTPFNMTKIHKKSTSQWCRQVEMAGNLKFEKLSLNISSQN